MRIVALTGVPGTGKTVLASLLARRHPVRSALELAREAGAVSGRDTDRDADVVDERVLGKAARRLLPQGDGAVVVEGLLAHFADPDLVVVLRCRPAELRRRLEAKGWPPAKVAENVEAERLDLIAAEVDCADAYELDTTGASADALAPILEALIAGGSVKDPRLGGLGAFDHLED